jgi:hypothetical protein
MNLYYCRLVLKGMQDYRNGQWLKFDIIIDHYLVSLRFRKRYKQLYGKTAVGLILLNFIGQTSAKT